MGGVRAGVLPRSPVVLLLGPGGIGKTRLAVAAARRPDVHLDGGAWLVELATVTSSSDVPRVVADALAVQDTAERTLKQSVVAALQVAAPLVVLDNCEHVLGGAAPSPPPSPRGARARGCWRRPGRRSASPTNVSFTWNLSIRPGRAPSCSPSAPGRCHRRSTRTRGERDRGDLPTRRRASAGHRAGRRPADPTPTGVDQAALGLPRPARPRRGGTRGR